VSLGAGITEPLEDAGDGPVWLGTMGDELDDPVSLEADGEEDDEEIDGPVPRGSQELDDPKSIDGDELDDDEPDDDEPDDPESLEPPVKGAGTLGASAFAIPVPSPRRPSSMPPVIAAPANNCFVLKVRLPGRPLLADRLWQAAGTSPRLGCQYSARTSRQTIRANGSRLGPIACPGT
jgi:hypothetical protein